MPDDVLTVLAHFRPGPAVDLVAPEAGRLRLVQKFGVGVNTVDVDVATERGIAVANMPGAKSASVAEGTVLLMLAAPRRLVGYGSVAQRVARIVEAMDATVLHTSTADDGRPGWRPLAHLLAAAGLDVFAVEPVPATNPLLGLAMWCRPRMSAGTRPTPCVAICRRRSTLPPAGGRPVTHRGGERTGGLRCGAPVLASPL